METSTIRSEDDVVIVQTCSNCGGTLRIPAQYAGQLGKCTHCGGIIVAENPPPPKPAAAPKRASRLVSLDVLRGFDMFWIIGADAIGRSLEKLAGGEEAPGLVRGVAHQLEHVSWEGFVFYDLIFPLFVFMVGMSAVLSLNKIIEAEGKAAAMKRIVRRAALLFFLGALYDAIDTGYADGFAKVVEENLLNGVLQRMALCYLFTSLLLCAFKVRGLVATFIVLLVGYWGVLGFIPSPEESTVVLEKGRNIIHYIDKQIPPYYGVDPESFMTTFPAIASCLLGAFAGLFIRDAGWEKTKQAGAFLLAGLALVVVGYLCSGEIPIIKRLWTPTYVFVAGGYSLMLLGLFVWLVDVKEWRWWIAPFLWIGSNSIAVYFFENVVDIKAWARLAVGEQGMTPGLEAFLALTGLALAIGFVHVLYRKKIFIRV